MRSTAFSCYFDCMNYFTEFFPSILPELLQSLTICIRQASCGEETLFYSGSYVTFSAMLFKSLFSASNAYSYVCVHNRLNATSAIAHCLN